MADYTWDTSIDVTSFDIGLVPNVRQLMSPLGGSGQAIDLVGERWRAVVGMPQSARLSSGRTEAMLNKLKGGANRVALWHMARPQPVGTLGGSPTLNGSVAQGASSIVLANAYPRNNSLRFPQEFDNAAWTKAVMTATANATTAPDGTTTADLLIPTTTAGNHTASQSVVGITSGQAVCVSIYAKASGANYLVLQLGSSGAFAGAPCDVRVDLSTGTFMSGQVGSPILRQIVDAGSGWWRIAIAATAVAAGSVQVINYVSVSSTVFSTAGDGTSGAYLWGAQFERASAPSAYAGSASTVAGDMIGLNGMLLQCDDAVGTSAGAITIPLITRLRKATTTGAAVTWDQPTALFRLTDAGGVMVGHSGRITREVQAEFLEDF